jgi:uridine kinase
MASEWPDRDQILRELACLIAASETTHPLRVAIDGTSAAGKTTLANELAEALRSLGRPVIRVEVDNFHNPKVVRYRRGELSPEGYYYDAVDYGALIALVLQPLGPEGSRRYRIGLRDGRGDTLLNKLELDAEINAVALIDGVFLMRPELDAYWDLRIFIQITPEAARERWLPRDLTWMTGESEVIERYEKRYLPGERLYLDLVHPELKADIVLNNTNLAQPVMRRRRDFG